MTETTTTLTPEQVALTQQQADPQADPIPSGPSLTGRLIGEACGHARKGERHLTRGKLDAAACLVRAIEYEIRTTIHEHNMSDLDTWRDQTIGLFAGPLTTAISKTVLQKHLKNEWLPIHYLVSSLPDETRVKARSVNWESLRILARWIIWEPNNYLFVPHDQYDESAYEESWRIKEGTETKLCELVAYLSRTPMDNTKLRETLNEFERTLSGEEKKPPAPRDTQKVINRFFEGISDRVASMKMDAAELYKQLVHRKLISPPDFGAINLATMTTQQAEALADAIGATGNVSAAAALVTKLRPYLMVASKPSGPVGASADSLGGMSREIRKSA